MTRARSVSLAVVPALLTLVAPQMAGSAADTMTFEAGLPREMTEALDVSALTDGGGVEETEEATPTGAGGFQELFRFETPRWHGQFASFPSAGPEAFIRVHGYGAVYAMADRDTLLWSRPASSFYGDWGLEPQWRVPITMLGWSPADPLAYASENPFAVSDVDGDGTDDVAVSHFLTAPPELRGSFVTVLDGRDGHALLSRAYEGFVSHVVAAELDPSPGAELIVASEPQNAPSVLEALSVEGDPAEARVLWTHDTGASGARFMHVDMVSDHPAHVGLSWSDKGFGEPGPKGTLAVLDERGDVAWGYATEGWARLFRPSGAQLVVQELADPEVAAPGENGLQYSLRAYRVADGQPLGGGVVRTGALLTQLAVGDVDGDERLEWVAAELVADEIASGWTATRVLSIEDDASIRWTYERPFAVYDHEVPEALAVIPGSPPLVAVAAQRMLPEPRVGGDTAPALEDLDLRPVGLKSDVLYAIRGDGSGTPALAWRHEDTGTYPLFLHRSVVDSRAVLLVGTEGRGGARAYDAATGSLVGRVNVLADPHAVAVHDVDDDGTRDILIGGSSEILYALDGAGLDPVVPRAVWKAEVGGTIHQIDLADLTGDGSPEAVVAATREIAAISLDDGEILWSHRRPQDRIQELYWTIGTGPLDGDGLIDVVVPGETLLALDGGDGSTLWEFDTQGAGGDPTYFSNVALADVDADGSEDVAAEFSIDFPLETIGPRLSVGAVVVDGDTGSAVWERRLVAEPPEWNNVPMLYRSVVTVPRDQGPAFGFAYLQMRPSAPAVAETSFARPRMDVLDGKDGSRIWTSGRLQILEPPHNGVVPSHRGADQMFLFSQGGFARVSDGEPVAEFHRDRVLGGSVLQDPSAEDRLIISAELDGLELYAPEVAFGPGGPGEEPPPLAVWEVGFDPNAEIVTADVDGDERPEILVVPWDCEVWDHVHSWMISAGCGEVFTPEGLAILELAT